MDFAQCTYLLSVLRMEKMRVVGIILLQNISSFQRYSHKAKSVQEFFKYLEDRHIFMGIHTNPLLLEL